MKILVTGGNGYIGGKIIPVLRRGGHEVDVYDMAIDAADDIFDQDRLAERMRAADAAFHLVAIPHPYESDEETYRVLNYHGAVKAFECAAAARIKKFVFASSGCVYGFWGGRAKPDQFPILEDNYKPSLEEGQSLYGYYKESVERYLAAHGGAAGIQCAAIRIEAIGTTFRASQLGRRYRMPGTRVVSEPLMHFLASCLQENYEPFLELLLARDWGTPFEAFNLGNRTIHPSIDVQDWIRRTWPEVPNHTRGNEALYGIEKAVRLLGYNPAV